MKKSKRLENSLSNIRLCLHEKQRAAQMVWLLESVHVTDVLHEVGATTISTILFPGDAPT